MTERAEISVSAAARMAKCSPDTVMHWIEEGAIEAWKTSPAGWWRIQRESLERHLERRRRKAQSENSANSERFSRAAHRF